MPRILLKFRERETFYVTDGLICSNFTEVKNKDKVTITWQSWMIPSRIYTSILNVIPSNCTSWIFMNNIRAASDGSY